MSRFTHFCPFQLPMGGSLGQKTSFLALFWGGFCSTLCHCGLCLWLRLCLWLSPCYIPWQKTILNVLGTFHPLWPFFSQYSHFSTFYASKYRFFNPICHVFNQNMTILTPNITKFAPLWTFSPKTWRYFPFVPNFCPKIWTFLCHCDSNMGVFNLLRPFLPQILPFLNIL